jgi:hypothetical protein
MKPPVYKVIRITFTTSMGEIILYSSSHIISVIKLRRIRLVGQVLVTGELKNAYKILVENMKENHSCRWEDNVKIILKTL